MRVRELIEHLRKCDPDAPVFLEDWNEEYADDADLTTVQRKKNPHGERVVLTVESAVEAYRPVGSAKDNAPEVP